jgi:hypothetical protein
VDLTLQYIADNRAHLLEELNRRQGILRDYVRGVALQYATGLYLFGRPGTAKTHTVRAMLETEIRVPYVYQRGHLTSMGLFDLIGEHPDRVIVLDDLAAVLNSPVALQILLSALEHPAPSDPTRSRLVKYKRQRHEEEVSFRGGVICISNRELHDDELLLSFKSRVHVLDYAPSDTQLGALILHLADLGWPHTGRQEITPDEARGIAHFLIGAMLRLGCRPDLRLFINKALPLYNQWKANETESEWRELVTASIEEHLVAVRYHGKRASRAERKLDEHAVLRQILGEHQTREAEVKAWSEQTGKSGRAFYRRLAELQTDSECVKPAKCQ